MEGGCARAYKHAICLRKNEQRYMLRGAEEQVWITTKAQKKVAKGK